MLQLCVEIGISDAPLEFDRRDCGFGQRDRRDVDLLLPHLREFGAPHS